MILTPPAKQENHSIQFTQSIFCHFPNSHSFQETNQSARTINVPIKFRIPEAIKTELCQKIFKIKYKKQIRRQNQLSPIAV